MYTSILDNLFIYQNIGARAGVCTLIYFPFQRPAHSTTAHRHHRGEYVGGGFGSFLFPKIFTFSNRRALSLWTESPLSRGAPVPLCIRRRAVRRALADDGGGWVQSLRPNVKMCLRYKSSGGGGGPESCVRERAVNGPDGNAAATTAPRRKPPIKTRDDYGSAPPIETGLRYNSTYYTHTPRLAALRKYIRDVYIICVLNAFGIMHTVIIITIFFFI